MFRAKLLATALMAMICSLSVMAEVEVVAWLRFEFSENYPYYGRGHWGPRVQVALLDSSGIEMGSPHGDFFPNIDVTGDFDYVENGVILSRGGGATPLEPEGRGTIEISFPWHPWYDNYAIGAVIIQYVDRSWNGWFGGHVTVESQGGRERQEVTLPAGGKRYTVYIDFTKDPPGVTNLFGWPSVVELSRLTVWLTAVLNPYKTLRIHAARLEELLVSRIWVAICKRVSW